MTAPRFLGRGVGLVAATGLVVGMGGLTFVGTASAGTYVYDLSSEAVAVESTMTDPNLPLGLPFSVASYGASSELNSNGESNSDAGAPYSPLVFSLPSTGNGIAQSTFGYGLPVVPAFPGYVSAKDPVLPKNEQNAGGYALLATALPKSASGKVSLGAQSATSEQNNAFALANSVATDSGIFTEGAAGVHALTLSGILDLFNVTSYASLRQDAGGAVIPVTTTNLGTVTLAGLASGLTGDGVTAFGSDPTPLSVDGLTALNDALKPAGIRFTYLPEEYRYADGSTSVGPTVDAKKEVAGLSSGALRIFFTASSDRGTTTETLTIGRVVVSATGNQIGGTSVSSSGGTAAGAGTTLPGTDLGTDLAAAPGVGVALGTVLDGTVPTQNFLPAAVGSRFLDEGRTDFGSFYLFLALGGIVTLVVAQVVRVGAVRRSA